MDIALNWIMQGVIVAIAAAAGLRVIPRSRTRARYGFVWVAYLLVLALPALSLVLATASDAAAIATPSISTGPVVTVPLAWWTSSLVTLSLWSLWIAINVALFVVGAMAVRNARRQSCECPPDVLAQLPHWSQVSTTGRPTRVVLSDRVRLAAVLGCGSPIIALAPRVVAALSVADLDRVLTHEWSHVQRRDDLAQLVQRILWIIVGWHPAAWWLERQLEFEREIACDEHAVSVTGSAKAYATCLATLAALPQRPIRLMPALGVSPSRLRRRLVRILTGSGDWSSRPWRALAIGGGGGLLTMALVVSNINVVASAVAVTSANVSTAAQLVSDAEGGANPLERSDLAPAITPQLKSIAGGARSPHKNTSADDPASYSPDVRHARTITGDEIDEPATVAVVSAPLSSTDWSLESRVTTPAAALTPERVSNATGEAARQADAEPTPWSLAADSGVAIGRASRSAGVATAGFFSRFGMKIAKSF